MKTEIAIATLMAAFMGAGLLSLHGCNSDADVASRNLSKAADQFEITRRVVFYNGITGEYMLTVEGLCSLGNYDKNREVSITCKVGPGAYGDIFSGCLTT
jgi:hypothetical protein